MMISLDALKLWIDRLANLYEERKTFLTDLDAAIGDADHGVNMARGFAAARNAVRDQPPATMGELCKTISMTLIRTIGGASGPLYGTLFMKMGPKLPGASASLADFTLALEAGVDGMAKMGKSGAGEKTMLDAWLPVLEALREAGRSGLADRDALAAAATAAEKGMKDTIPMVATKGRASYLGERSAGHQDPGATSTYLMLQCLAGALS